MSVFGIIVFRFLSSSNIPIQYPHYQGLIVRVLLAYEPRIDSGDMRFYIGNAKMRSCI